VLRLGLVGEALRVARHQGVAVVLRDDVTVEEAIDVLWMLCGFDSFDLLYTDRGLSADEAIDLIVRTAERALCRT
jgi:hypothetical protein